MFSRNSTRHDRLATKIPKSKSGRVFPTIATEQFFGGLALLTPAMNLDKTNISSLSATFLGHRFDQWRDR